MPKRVIPLTNTEVRNAKPRAKEYSLYDGFGLSLKVRPVGTKMWVFNFVCPVSKRRTNISLGTYPDITLRAARSAREDYRMLLRAGTNPKDHRKSEREASNEAASNTLVSVAEQWLAIKKNEITPRYLRDIHSSLVNHVFPVLGNRPVSALSAKEVIAAIGHLRESENLEMAKRVCQRLNKIMNFACRTGLITHNPISGIGDAFPAPAKRHLPSIPPSELPALCAAIQHAQISPITQHLIRFQMHTMTRSSEAAGVTWEEVDFENRLWRIPAERMKKRREHAIPLSNQVVALLREMKLINGHRKHVFVSRCNVTMPVSSSTVNMALRRMGYGGKLVAHGLRSLASTTLNEKGFDPDIIEAALAHTDQNMTRAAYNRSLYLARRRVMMQWWSDCIDGNPQASIGDGKILNFPEVAANYNVSAMP